MIIILIFGKKKWLTYYKIRALLYRIENIITKEKDIRIEKRAI